MNRLLPVCPAPRQALVYVLLLLVFAFGENHPLWAAEPQALADTAATTEDLAVSIAVLGNDSDPDNDLDTSSLALALPPSFGSAALTDTLGGLFLYTPNANANGTDSFAYRLCDTLGACDTAWVVVEVAAVNDPPQVLADDFDVFQGIRDTLFVLANDGDPLDPLGGLDTSSLAFVSFPSSGSVSILGTLGAITYESLPSFSGMDSFQYRVFDQGFPAPGIPDTAWARINILLAKPEVVDDNLLATEDTPLELDVLANDSDPQNNIDSSSLSLLRLPAKGTALVDLLDVNIDYTPDPDSNGLDSLSYQLCDLTGLCDSATVLITVAAVNDAPLVLNDTLVLNEDAVATADVLANDNDSADPAGGLVLDSLLIQIAPLNGAAAVVAGQIEYTPDPEFFGADSLRYRICDAGNPLPTNCAEAWLILEVLPINDPPLVLNDTAATLEDVPVPVSVLANDSDVEDGTPDPASVAISAAASFGSLLIDGVTGVVTYTPDPNANGLDSFRYRACDLDGACDSAWVRVDVAAVNDAPIALNDTAVLNEDAVVAVDVLANDNDSADPAGGLVLDSLLIQIAPLNGAAAVVAGQIEYTPDPEFFGADSLRYRICDAGNPLPTNCAEAWLILEVLPINDPPLVLNDTAATLEDVPVPVSVLANDSDVEDGTPDPASVAVSAAASFGSLLIDGVIGVVTYTPDPNANGLDSFRYRACDLDGACDSAWVLVDVAAVNDAPNAVDDSLSVNEDAVLTALVLANDDDAADPTGGLVLDSASIVLPPSNGIAVVLPDASIEYTPNPDFFGSDLLRYRICDSGVPLPSLCSEAELEITVLPINDPPLVLADTAATVEDSPVLVNVLINDSDPEDGSLDPGSVAISAPALAGGLVVSGLTGQVTYTPDPNANGLDSFRYRACDLDGACDSAWVLVDVSPVNDAPTVQDDSLSTDEDTPVLIDVLVNDSDPLDGGLDGGAMDPASVAITLAPAIGTAVVLPSGSIEYTPAPDASGLVSFTYTACDTGSPVPALCGTAEVLVLVLPVNDPPVVLANADTTLEDAAVVTNVLSNDSDLEDGALLPTGVSIFTPPANGTANVLPLTGQISYTPDPNFNGTDRYVYEACDLDGACDTAGVALLIQPVNDPPVALLDVVSTPEDVPLAISILENDDDAADDLGTSVGGVDSSSITVVIPPSFGTAVPDLLTGQVTYTPDPDYNGPDSFAYRICDLGFPLPALCDQALVRIAVTGENDPPVLVNDAASLIEDGNVSIDVLVNDSDVEDGAPLGSSVSIAVPPNFGTAVPDGVTGAVLYTPFPNYNGPDAFTYQACDLDGACATAVVSLSVAAVNDVPLAGDDVAIGSEDAALSISILANDNDNADPAGGLDPSSLVSLVAPLHGSVVYDFGTGEATYTPNPDFNGVDSFRYQICDLGAPLPSACTNAVVQLAIAPVNDTPLIQNDAEATPENTAVAIDVLANDSDPDDPLASINPSSLSVVSPPANGSASLGPGPGIITYTPDPGFLGLDSFPYQVCDNGNPLPPICGTAWVVVTVSDEAPTAIDDLASTDEEVAVLIEVLANDTDPQPNIDTGTLNVVLAPSDGLTVVDGVLGTVTYTPDVDFNGTDAFSYRICDEDGFCDQATVTVTVNPINDPPLVNLDLATTSEDLAVPILVLGNDSDPSDPLGSIDPSTVAMVSPPANGGVSVDPISGTVTYTPDPDFNGLDAFTYSVCDDGNPLPAECGSANVLVTINAVNDVPVVVNDTASTNEDVVLNLNIIANDSDVEDGGVDPTSLSIVNPPDDGTAFIDPVSGQLTYTPDPDYYGPDLIRYRACDLDGACAEADVILTVDPVNDVPSVVDDAATTDEDLAVAVDVLSNDSDPVDPMGGIDATSVSLLSPPANGLASIDPVSGAITYTPDPDFNGTDVLSYQVCDLGFPTPVACNSADLSITINPINDAPIVQDDVATTAEDVAVLVPVLANDNDAADPAGGLDAGSVVVLTAPINGTTSVGGGGGVTYTPDPGFNGLDSFRYQVCDLGHPLPALCGEAWALVDVSNESPTAVNDTVLLNEDGSFTVDVLANDTDPQNNIDPSAVSIVLAPAFGTAVPDPITGEVVYTPVAHYNGTDAFEYRVCDLIGYCDEARVELTIAPVNDAPLALNDSETTPEDVLVSTAVLFNDSDPLDPAGNLDTASVTVILAPSNGVATVLLPSGEISYQPDPDFFGTDSYTYRVCDDGNPLPALCDQAVVVVNVLPVDDPLVAVDDAATVGIGSSLAVPVLDNDIDPDGDIDLASVSIVTGPLNGTAVPDLVSGNVDYTPDPGFFGLDTFFYRVCDLPGNCSQARVIMTVTASPPVAVLDSFTVLPNSSNALEVLVNDLPGSAPLDPATISVTLLAANGTATADPTTGRIDYSPDPDYCGPDSLAYAICDEDGLCASALVRIDVTCIEFFALDDSVTTPFDEAVSIPVLANDAPNADPACLLVFDPPLNGMVVVNGDGSITYTPDAGFTGEDCFRYRVCDNTESVVAEAEVCVTVEPEVEVQVPVAISPNGDGKNDVWIIPGLGDWPRHELVVFNRWEDRVFAASPYTGDWDGRWEGNGEPLPDGAYFYILQLDPQDPDAPVLAGSVNITR